MRYILNYLITPIVLVIILGSCKDNKFGGYLYPISENGLYGYIDSVGNRIIEPKFLWASTFSNGLAMIIEDTIYREANDSMKFETELNGKIEKVYRLYAKYGYIDKSGDYVIQPTYTCYITMPEKGYVENELGNLSDKFSRYRFNNGLALFEDSITRKKGYINTKGEIIIAPEFYYAKQFSNGKAVVYKNTGDFVNVNGICITQSKLRGTYIDVEGKPLTDFKFENLTDFRANRGIGTYNEITNDSLGFCNTLNLLIDKKGNIVDTLSFFSEYYGYSDDGICVGKQVVFFEYAESFQPILDYFDKKGDLLKPLKGLTETQLDVLSKRNDIMSVLPEDVELYYGTFFDGGLAGASVDGEHWFVIDKYMLIHGYGEESIYQRINGFSNGLAAVKKNGKWGYINNKIKEVIPCKYDSCEIFAYPYLETVFLFDKNGKVNKVMMINRKDSVVWENNILERKDIKNKYSIKEKKDFGKWIESEKSNMMWYISIPVVALTILLIIVRNRNKKGANK